MKVASAWSADEERVRLCFLVKVRKAIARRLAGGKRMGRMEAFGAGASEVFIGFELKLGLIGCMGVAKAGEEEGMGSVVALLTADLANGFGGFECLGVSMVSVCACLI